MTETDVTNRRYESLGDVTAVLSKWTLFSPDPTTSEVVAALRRKASDLGADAIVLIRYGVAGITPWTYGQLSGTGRAVRFVD